MFAETSMTQKRVAANPLQVFHSHPLCYCTASSTEDVNMNTETEQAVPSDQNHTRNLPTLPLLDLHSSPGKILNLKKNHVTFL